MNKSIKDYTKLPYTRIVKEIKGDPHYYYGQILELDGCHSTGDTLEELYKNLDEVLEMYLETLIENDMPIPEPIPSEDDGYSGKFMVRIPRSLHKRLATEAKKEGVSLNQFAAMKLAQ